MDEVVDDVEQPARISTVIRTRTPFLAPPPPTPTRLLAAT